jgi:hypothetical protein
MEILNMLDLGRTEERNTVAKPTNPQNVEINDWSKTVAGWCQRVSKSQLTLVEAVTKRTFAEVRSVEATLWMVGHSSKSGVPRWRRGSNK